jgi:hypothetical protein
VYTAGGRDLGQYKYGQDQLSYILANIGKYGFTQQEYNDVKARYDAIAAQYGQAAADAYHYGWNPNKPVSTTGVGGTPGPSLPAAKPKAAVISTRQTVVQPSTPVRTH